MRRNAPCRNRFQQDCISVATIARSMPHGVASNRHFNGRTHMVHDLLRRQRLRMGFRARALLIWTLPVAACHGSVPPPSSAASGAVGRPTPTKGELMNHDASTRTISIRHVEVRSTLPPRQVHDRLLAVLPRLDPRLADMARRGDNEAVERERRDGPSLWLFEVRDMGSLLGLEGRAARVYQYEIGNPLTAESMIRYNAGAGQYAPLRVVLYEENGGSIIAYDSPSDLFGQFGDERVTKVGYDLDRELESVLDQALAP